MPRRYDGRAPCKDWVNRITDPCRPKGYPWLAATVNNNEDYFIFRKFGYLRCRLILHCQEELAGLERRLASMDNLDEAGYPSALESVQVDESRQKPKWRKELFEKAKAKFEEYDRLLSGTRTCLSLPEPSVRAYDAWLDKVLKEPPLQPKDMEFIKQSADLISLAPRQERNSMDAIAESIFAWFQKKQLMQAFTISPAKRERRDERFTNQLVKQRIEIIVRTIIVLLVVTLLSTPTMVLSALSSNKAMQFLVVTIYTLVFSICLSVTTSARRQDQFAVCAASTAPLKDHKYHIQDEALLAEANSKKIPEYLASKYCDKSGGERYFKLTHDGRTLKGWFDNKNLDIADSSAQGKDQVSLAREEIPTEEIEAAKARKTGVLDNEDAYES
ncbi:MAG: hypothetical protein Q9163_002422 [Psora crenata]